jgi:undecaprenyl-phosphate galactose phosphotransferase
LRRTSLDELPQLINVIRGEMSLVGPRPVVRSELPRYGDQVGYYLMVRPGMTGLWQVSGRNDVDYDTRVYLDSWYVKNWSLWHDLVILFKTVSVVLSRQGAY